ncbi:hypothetical protein ASPZODRAFT_126503 [Penicilliopsis zonata CBS 506.65]|uniref:Uncharacterized protein n=1 Tax=Penicilliopsis zonata CBS 506.65 TaxID=1073090 RepID=A0A1L9STS7_9EURO|nr:hypothetical protein ASPZODRAFT_126503 [Penicilliopsis zonata CBS 506.65]OJJ50612.1 hypothetical protein ASPZODRAFT_126503 [Penicilliopsis zonata CBS 506.65]
MSIAVFPDRSQREWLVSVSLHQWPYPFCADFHHFIVFTDIDTTELILFSFFFPFALWMPDRKLAKVQPPCELNTKSAVKVGPQHTEITSLIDCAD